MADEKLQEIENCITEFEDFNKTRNKMIDNIRRLFREYVKDFKTAEKYINKYVHLTHYYEIHIMEDGYGIPYFSYFT